MQVYSKESLGVGCQKQALQKNHLNHCEISLAAFWEFAAMRPLKSAGLTKSVTNLLIFELDIFPKLWAYICFWNLNKINKSRLLSLWFLNTLVFMPSLFYINVHVFEYMYVSICF